MSEKIAYFSSTSSLLVCDVKSESVRYETIANLLSDKMIVTGITLVTPFGVVEDAVIQRIVSVVPDIKLVSLYINENRPHIVMDPDRLLFSNDGNKNCFMTLDQAKFNGLLVFPYPTVQLEDKMNRETIKALDTLDPLSFNGFLVSINVPDVHCLFIDGVGIGDSYLTLDQNKETK